MAYVKYGKSGDDVMEPENVQEYKFMREEITDVTRCITEYMGFVMGGSAVSLLSLATVGSLHLLTEIDTTTFLFYGPIGMSVLLLTLTIIIIYKFDSRNFHSGYCKLLSVERWDRSHHPTFRVADLIVWEWCIEILRQCDQVPLQLQALMQTVGSRVVANNTSSHDGRPWAVISKDIEHRSKDFIATTGPYTSITGQTYRRIDAPINYRMIRGGCRLLRQAIWSFSVRSSSWKFPIHVMVVVFWLNLVFFLTFFTSGIYGIFVENSTEMQVWFMSITGIIGLVFEVRIWFYFLSRLYTLMLGDSMVDSYYLRFIPIRIYILEQDGIVIRRF